MKLYLISAVIGITILVFVVKTHNSHSYSPMDSYISGIKNNIRDSIKHSNEVRMYLDSLRATHVNVVKSVKDERGYTSVVYTKGADTFALDYLTKDEYFDLTNK